MKTSILNLFKISIKKESKLGYLMIGYILTAAMIPYFGLLFLWTVAKRLPAVSVGMWLGAIGVFALIEMLFTVGNSYCYFSLDTTITSLRMMFGRELSARLFDINYENLEDEHYLKKMYHGFYFLDGSHFGIHKIYVNSIQWISLGVAFLLMAGTISQKGCLYFPFILLFAVIFLGLLEILCGMSMLFEELVYEAATLQEFMVFLKESPKKVDLKVNRLLDMPLVINNLSFRYPHYLGGYVKRNKS